MRSSSIKTVVVALSLTVTLVAAAPRAEARSSQPTRARVGATDRLQRAFSQFMKRFGVRFSSEHLPSDPIPSLLIEETETEVTINVPKKER